MLEEKGRTGNVKRNIIYAFGQVIASQFLPFVVRTILIKCFGVEYLGLNSMFTSLLSVLSLVDFGFGTAVVYSMYKPVADNNTSMVCAYLCYYRKIYRVIGLIILGAGLLLMPFLKYLIYNSILPIGLNLYICYLIFLGDSVISYLLYGYMTAIPIVFQRRDRLSRVEMGMTVLKCIVQSLVLLIKHDFYLYLFFIPMVTIMRNLIIAQVVKKRYPGIRCRGSLTELQKKDLNRRIYGLFVNKLTAVSRNSIDSVCISAFIGLAMTGMYNNYFLVITALLSFSGVICNSMMASVGNSIAMESVEKNYHDLRIFDFIYMSIIGWATVCLLCLFQPFISIWLGDKMMLNTSIVIGLSLYFYILKSGDIRWVYHEGAGLWYESRFIMVGEAAVNILLNVKLCKAFGIFGIVLATVLSVFLTNMILCPRIMFRLYFKNGKLKEYWLDHMQYTSTMSISAVISWVICKILFPLYNGIIELIGRFIICSIISVIVFWSIWHRSKRYKKAITWTTKMIKT